MPVEDVAVHDKVKIGSDFRYGCHSSRNPKKSSGYFAANRVYFAHNSVYDHKGEYVTVLKYIPHANTTKCRSFSLWDTDPACEGCQSERDIEYRDKCLALR